MIGAIVGKRKVRSKFDDLNKRDVQAFTAGWAEDATFIFPSYISAGGEIKGKKAIEEWFNKWMEQFPKVNFVVKNVFVSNVFAFGSTNVFAVEWDENVTNRDGKDFQYGGVTVIQVKNGLATLVRDYIPEAEILKRAWGEEKT